MIEPAHYSSTAEMRARYRAIHAAFWPQPTPAHAQPEPPLPEPPPVELPAGFAALLRTPVGRFEQIVVAVCNEFHVTRHDLFGQSRRAFMVAPRWLTFALARHLARKNLSEIARRAGGFDHSTVLYALRKLAPVFDAVKDGMPSDATPAEWVRVMREHMGV